MMEVCRLAVLLQYMKRDMSKLILYYYYRFILYNFFPILLIYEGLGVGVLDWVLLVGVSVEVVCGLWCGAFWVLWGRDSLYKYRKTNLGKKLCQGQITPDFLWRQLQ